MNDDKFEILMNIGRIYSEKSQSWLPSVRVIDDHEHHPAWTAALMYLILDRYISSMEDQKQDDYISTVMKYLKEMLENGQSYLEELDSADELE